MAILRFYSRHGEQQLDVAVAATVATRLRGLLARPPLRPDQGLLLSPCNMVHTVGMRYPLDVVFLRHDGRVLHVAQQVPSNRLRLCWRARYTLELAAGTAARCAIAPGMDVPVGRLT
jgi:uncharacterized membrane protein (UPF0127 family)